MPYYVPREWSPQAAEKIQLNFERLFQAVAEAAPTTVIETTVVVEAETPPPINAGSTTWEIFHSGTGVTTVGMPAGSVTGGITTVRAAPPFADAPYIAIENPALNSSLTVNGPTGTNVAMDLIWDFDMTAIIRTDATTTTQNRRYLIGICQANLTAAAMDSPTEAGCWFRYSTFVSDLGWVALCHDGTTLSSASEVITPIANSTRYLLRIRKVANQAFFSINGGPETVVNSNVPITTRPGVSFKMRLYNLSGLSQTLYFSRAWCVYGS